MAKYKKPLRGIRDELFDVDWDYVQRERVVSAYQSFWSTLDDETKEELNLMLY